ncbi:MAG: AsmA-like C-terminal domain-containing protein [Syntrophales bacterium]|jgi:hypothetical protein|nr:AsmA-like C-terminal domain-containing protein [Syntrophales bacterium]MDY0043654.1 AsmA-like C-terminal domain-containing protein [Syntrophales bacterium]
MRKGKKIGLWIGGVIGIVLVLFVIAMIAMPLVIDRQDIKNKIASRLSQELGGEVEFGAIRTSFFPPKGEISNLRLRLSVIDGAVESVRADLKILPLFTGKVRIGEIFIREPDLTIALPAITMETGEAPRKGENGGIQKKVKELLGRIEERMPDATIRIRNGTIVLTEEEEPLYRFQHVAARIETPPGRLAVDISSRANIWKSMTVKGAVEADGSKATGTIEIAELQLQSLARYFAPAAANTFPSALLTFKSDLETPDFKSVQGALEGRARHEKIPYPVEVSKARFFYDPQQLTIGDFKLNTGESSLAVSSARIGLTGEKTLKVESTSADLSMDTLLAWAVPMLSPVEGIEKFAAEYKDMKGRVLLSSVDISGPLAAPSEWDISGKVSLENIVFSIKELPAPVRIAAGAFEGTRGRISFEIKNAALMESNFSLSGHIEDPGAETALIDLSAAGDIGPGAVQWLTKRFDLPEQITSLRGAFRIAELNVKGPVAKPKELAYSGKGAFDSVIVETTRFPDAVTVESGEFAVTPAVLTVKGVRVAAQGSSMTLSGSAKGYSDGTPLLEFVFNGLLSEKTAAWLKAEDYLSPWARIDAPIALSGGRLLWGAGTKRVEAVLTKKEDLRIAFDIEMAPQKIIVRTLTIDDPESSVRMTAVLREDVYETEYKGHLTQGTLRKLIQGREDLIGWTKGDFKLHVSRQKPSESRVTGTIQVGGFAYGEDLKAPVQVRELSITGDGSSSIRIDSAGFTWRQTDIDLKGRIGFSPEKIVLDLVAATGGFDWEKVRKIAREEGEAGEKSGKGAEGATGILDKLNIEGKVALMADYFKYDDLTWRPFHAVANLEGNRLRIDLDEGSLCGIQMDAAARVAPDPMRLEAEAKAKEQELASVLNCFLENRLMTGDMDLTGRITAKGISQNFFENLQGRFKLTAEDGRIFRFGLLAKILAVVNITEILKGQAPDLTGAGFGYTTAQASGVIENGVVTLEETFIDGKSIDLAFTGNLNIPEKKIDLTVLVTPLKTVDTIIEMIPIIGHIAGKNFMAIPVRVSGDLSNPAVTPMSPTAVGRGLLGVLERTLKLPVKVVQPFLPDEKQNE